ncbi:hypothetical protein [Oceanirhabdus seepicola]|uniref:Uncharacterized protein n=1 Tax=Oceanirhabdus seepicola TaxID=2828781 RepID=A0A9J6P8B8_9CLOT|nr:hypothetical protein [Oceanirhabdus seepicola]MCM1992161.1 hypothetical protein [Oceanirhabdus seepicola]
MKKKIIIISIVVVSILCIINFFYPRNLGNLIDKNELIINVQSIEIRKMTVSGGDKVTLITDKVKIKELIEYFSKHSVRKSIPRNVYNGNEIYEIFFNGNNIENTGWIQIFGGKYITCNTYKQRVSQRRGTIPPYIFVTDFDFEYFKQAFYKN